MKLADPSTTFEGSLPAGTRLTFQLKSNPKMFAILSDGIYADKIAAVIRELSCNAHDSNVMARSPKPFTVNVPTSLETNFWVEDTGLGIDPEKIVDIFWTYGASTKTDSNETIGALGLGSKSPFAYTKSSFLVINRYNGVEYKYFCFINEAGIPDGKLMYQSATTEPNGVRVELAVRIPDIGAFRERIVRFFSFWDDANLPTFAGDTSVEDSIKAIKAGRKLKGKTWELRGLHDDVGRGAYAVMGGVPYPINRRALTNPSPALEMVCDSQINITFPMGSLDFQVSREELSYTDETIAALEKGAQGIVQDILEASKAKLVGYKTPYELAKAYRAMLVELQRTFAHVGRLMTRHSFELADGRKFTGEQLCNGNFRIEAKRHVEFGVYRVERQVRDYSKGTQRYGLENELMVTMSSPVVIDPVTKKITQHSTTARIDWFKLATTPAVWTNTTRKRTAANYLHAGFKVDGTVFEYNSSSSSFNAIFIINDMHDRGAEGMRFYTENFAGDLYDVYSHGHLYFVDGSTSALDGDATEAALRAFIAGTLLEGTQILRLSKLSKFKLPEAPKVDPKVRAPIQRGTIEQRMTVFTFVTPVPGATPKYTIEFADSFELQFRSPNATVTDYKRHDVTKPMLYIDTNWGAPLTPFDKQCVNPELIGALYTLGLLQEFEVQTAVGAEVRVGMLSPNHVEEMKRRNVRLVSFKELLVQAKALFDKEVELHAAFNSRADGYDADDARVTLSRLLSKHFIKYGLPLLPKGNMIANLATAQDRIKKLLKGNQALNALVFLALRGWAGSADDMAAKLAGTVKVGDLLVSYPLLSQLSYSTNHSSDAVVHVHVAGYIKMVDEMHAQAKEAQRLEQLAQLHAEALFEAN